MTRRHRANGGMRFFNEARNILAALQSGCASSLQLKRRISSFSSLMQIALVLIDEVHLLNEKRGSSLEAGVISRIKMVSKLREMCEVNSRSTFMK